MSDSSGTRRAIDPRGEEAAGTPPVELRPSLPPEERASRSPRGPSIGWTCEANGVTEVRLNGQPLGVRWWGRHTYGVAGTLRPGANTLEVGVTTVVANYARSLKDTPAAQR